MATIQDIIDRALQKIAVQSSDEDSTTYDAAKALNAYNDMTHGFKLAGVDLEHTDQALTDTFAFGAEYREGFVYLLASRLSPDYMVPASFDADDWFRKFQAANITIADVTFDAALTVLPSEIAEWGYTTEETT